MKMLTKSMQMVIDSIYAYFTEVHKYFYAFNDVQTFP